MTVSHTNTLQQTLKHTTTNTKTASLQIGVKDEIVKADVVSPAGQTKSTTAVTQELFNALSQEDIDAMFEFYKLDFVLFGYEKDVNSPTFPYPSIPERQG